MLFQKWYSDPQRRIRVASVGDAYVAVVIKAVPYYVVLREDGEWGILDEYFDLWETAVGAVGEYTHSGPSRGRPGHLVLDIFRERLYEQLIIPGVHDDAIVEGEPKVMIETVVRWK